MQNAESDWRAFFRDGKSVADRQSKFSILAAAADDVCLSPLSKCSCFSDTRLRLGSFDQANSYVFPIDVQNRVVFSTLLRLMI